MYGFSDPTIKMLIQELPNADKCSTYQWQTFDVTNAAPPKVKVEKPERGPTPPATATNAAAAEASLNALKQIQEQIKQLESLTRAKASTPQPRGSTQENFRRTDAMDVTTQRPAGSVLASDPNLHLTADAGPPLGDFATDGIDDNPEAMFDMWENI